MCCVVENSLFWKTGEKPQHTVSGLAPQGEVEKTKKHQTLPEEATPTDSTWPIV